jgi:hypothetical protein
VGLPTQLTDTMEPGPVILVDVQHKVAVQDREAHPLLGPPGEILQNGPGLPDEINVFEP